MVATLDNGKVMPYFCVATLERIEGEGPYNVSKGLFVRSCTSGRQVCPKPFWEGDCFRYLCLACARPPCKKCGEFYAPTMEYSKPWNASWTGYCGSCTPSACGQTKWDLFSKFSGVKLIWCCGLSLGRLCDDTGELVCLVVRRRTEIFEEATRERKVMVRTKRREKSF